MAIGGPVEELAAALQAARAAVVETDYPLPLPSAAHARLSAAALAGQLDSYALPRVSQLDAPMLVVVGGSTGAGKSTLVNSLVRAPVSPAGVLRPTTRSPVLVCHPADTPWYRGDQPLGRLVQGQSQPRAGSVGDGHAGVDRRLQTISAPALPRGLAFIDAPDIDSVVASNRALALQLFDVADLWLFVTTPARYADAVPWQLLHAARDRGTVVALVLDRVPPESTAELVPLVSELLTEQGLGRVPLFVVPETGVDRQGLLPEPVLEPVRSWFDRLAADEPARASVIRCTLDGALAAMVPRLAELAAAADEQFAAAESLAEQVGMAYGVARGTIERGVRAGVIRPTEPPAADAPATEEWSRALRATVGGWRDQLAALTGRSAGARHRQTAIESGLVTLVRSAMTEAAEQTDVAWRGNQAGAALLAEALSEPSGAAGDSNRSAGGGRPGENPELAWRIQAMAREWQNDDLLGRVGELLDEEATRWLERLAGAPTDGTPGQRLREVAAELERARVAAQLTPAAQPAAPPVPPATAGAPSASDPAPPDQPTPPSWPPPQPEPAEADGADPDDPGERVERVPLPPRGGAGAGRRRDARAPRAAPAATAADHCPGELT